MSLDQAKLMQKHFEENKRLRAALEEIANPIAAFQRKAKAEGAKVNGSMAVMLSNDPGYLKEIARKALA